MVLQRNKPIEVWGYDATYGETLDVMIDVQHSGEVSWTEAIAGKDGSWRATLSAPPPHVVGKPLLLALSRRGADKPAQVLEDVVLGDVYLFSGQSNVDLPVSYVHQFNPQGQEAEETFADSVGQTGLLRLMIVPARCGLMYADADLASEFSIVKECVPCPPPFGTDKAPLRNLNSCNMLGGHSNNWTYCNCDSLFWTRPSGAKVRGFSAVAWFSGKALLSANTAKGVPIGLIRSSWGATNIAVWSGADALSKCPQEGRVPTSFAPYVRSALFAHMIHPLRGLQLSAVVWVHGARNIGSITAYMGGTYYSCALKAMITDWRKQLNQVDLPFLIVESPVYCNEHDYRTWHTWCDDRDTQLRFPDEHLPEMRMAQNDAEALPSVYLVSVMDQGSLARVMGGAIHSERKPELGMRLAVAARAAVYQDKKAVWSGPTATFAWQSAHDEISVCFNTRGGGRLLLNESAICPSVVNPVYCPGATFELFSKGVWSVPSSISILGGSVTLKLGQEVGPVERVRYAWADWPICSVLSEAGLPARLFNLRVRSEDQQEGLWCPEDGTGGIDSVGDDDSGEGQAGQNEAGGPEVITAAKKEAKEEVVPQFGPFGPHWAMWSAAALGAVIAAAVVAVRWGVLARLEGRGAEERTPDVPDFAALPSSKTSSLKSSAPLMKVQGNNPPPAPMTGLSPRGGGWSPLATPSSSRDRGARGPMARQQQSFNKGRTSSQPPRSIVLPEDTRPSDSPLSPRSASPGTPRSRERKAAQPGQAEEVPLIKPERSPPKEPTKYVFRMFGKGGK